MSIFLKKSQHPDRTGEGGSTLTVSLTVKRHFFSRRLPEEFDVIVIIQNVWEATGT